MTDPTANTPAASPGGNGNLGAEFSAGWLIAQLHAPLLEDLRHPELLLVSHGAKGLPATDQFDVARRVNLAIKELDKLLKGPLQPYLADDTNTTQLGASEDWTPAPASVTTLRTNLESFHEQLLTQLTVSGPLQGAAYALGAWISDTCCLPTNKEQFAAAFSKSRITTIQGWLSDVGAHLPQAKSAPVVSQGLDNWSAWLGVDPIGNWDTPNTNRVISAARTQAEHWRSLLAGEKNPADLLTPEGWVDAGESALQRAGSVIRRVFLRFWVPILAVLLLTAGAVVLAVHYAAGTAKVWTSLVSVAAGLGITGKSIQSTVKRLGNSAEQSLVGLAEVDAMSWSATVLPDIAVSRLKTRQLRNLGTSPPTPGTGLPSQV